MFFTQFCFFNLNNRLELYTCLNTIHGNAEVSTKCYKYVKIVAYISVLDM